MGVNYSKMNRNRQVPREDKHDHLRRHVHIDFLEDEKVVCSQDHENRRGPGREDRQHNEHHLREVELESHTRHDTSRLTANMAMRLAAWRLPNRPDHAGNCPS